MQRAALTRIVSSFALLPVLLPPLSTPAEDKVDFSIVGRIQFTVPGEWKVIASKSNASRTTFAFQISNPADEGTPDSTNLVLIAYNLSEPPEKQSFEEKRSLRGPSAADQKLVDNWDCSAFSAKQGHTSYVVWDCTRTVGQTGVYVRLAWPQLAKNPPGYDESMKAALSDVLKSVIPYSTPSESPKAHGN